LILGLTPVWPIRLSLGGHWRASLNSGQEKLCLLTHLDLAGTLWLAVDLMSSSLRSIQTSDRRGAGGRFQSLVLDIRIKD
jgi:hypothetical protein